MSASSSDDAELLRRTEQLLEQEPEGQDAALSRLLQDLGTLWDKPATETLEQAFQLFGTAVGKHSKLEQRHQTWKVPANRGLEGWQTLFRDTGILAWALKDLDSSNNTSTLRKQYLRTIGNCVADNGTCTAPYFLTCSTDLFTRPQPRTCCKGPREAGFSYIRPRTEHYCPDSTLQPLQRFWYVFL
jgi:hypothetical protein